MENSCGFLMWHYKSDYMASSGILDAVNTLSAEAKNGSSSCPPGGEPPPPPPEDVPPVASFTGARTDLACAFTDARGDTDGSIASRTWDCDGKGSTATNPTHTYPAAGPYTVTLTVTDDKGATAVASNDVTPKAPPVVVPGGNLSPSADFTFSCIRLSCMFSDKSSDADGRIASRSRTFGNGSTSMSSLAWRTYAAAGTYTVTLSVIDDDGASSSTSHGVTVR